MSENIPGAHIARQGQGERFQFMGGPVEVLVSDKDTNGAYALMDATFAPGSGAPPHIHTNEDEFFVILEGELEFHVGDNVTRAKAGDVVHAARGHRHFFVNPTDKPARAQIGIVPGNFLNFFRAMSAPIGAAPAPPDVPLLVAEAAKYGCTIFAPGA